MCIYSGASTSSAHSVVQNPRHYALYTRVQEWNIVPTSVYSLTPAPPSLIYGAVHLTRLFGKHSSFIAGNKNIIFLCLYPNLLTGDTTVRYCSLTPLTPPEKKISSGLITPVHFDWLVHHSKKPKSHCGQSLIQMEKPWSKGIFIRENLIFCQSSGEGITILCFILSCQYWQT